MWDENGTARIGKIRIANCSVLTIVTFKLSVLYKITIITYIILHCLNFYKHKNDFSKLDLSCGKLT